MSLWRLKCNLIDLAGKSITSIDYLGHRRGVKSEFEMLSGRKVPMGGQEQAKQMWGKESVLIFTALRLSFHFMYVTQEESSVSLDYSEWI